MPARHRFLEKKAGLGGMYRSIESRKNNHHLRAMFVSLPGDTVLLFEFHLLSGSLFIVPPLWRYQRIRFWKLRRDFPRVGDACLGHKRGYGGRHRKMCAFDGIADSHIGSLRSWHVPFHVQEVSLRVNFIQPEVLHCHPLSSKTTRHLFPLEDTARGRILSRRAQGSMRKGRAVGCPLSFEIPSFHDALETLAFACPDHIYQLARHEMLG